MSHSRVLLLVSTGIVVFLFLFGSFEYISYTQTSVRFVGVEFTGVTPVGVNASSVISEALKLYTVFSSPTAESVAEALVGVIQSVNFNFTFQFHNYGVLPVYVLSETHQLFVNGILVGTGSSSGFWVPAGGSVSMTVSQALDPSDLVSILRSAVLSGGQVKFVMVGTASLGIGGFPYSMQGSANLLAFLAAKLNLPLPTR